MTAPGPRYIHAEMSWQDLIAFIFAFTPASLLALCFGHHGYTVAKKAGLKQHPIGMVGLIFGAIGTIFWCLFFLLGGCSAYLGGRL